MQSDLVLKKRAGSTLHTTLEIIFTKEEKKFVERMQSSFEDEWQSFSFGEGLLNEIVHLMAGAVEVLSVEYIRSWRIAYK